MGRRLDAFRSFPDGHDVFVFGEEETVLQIQFQTKCTKDGVVMGAEVLLRDVATNTVPRTLLRSTLENGTSHELSEAILSAVLHEVQLLTQRGVSVPISVNVHPDDFSKKFVDTVQLLLQQTAVQPENLELEITEDEPLSEEHLVPMHALRELGVGLALDDFGTGHANEAALLAIPDFQTVKIAREVLLTGKAPEMADALIEKCYTVVVEGVETQEQLDSLPDRCLIQGFLLSGPAMPSAELLRVLTN